ncbi:TPA: hypothetical protein ACPVG6_003376 [Escherichia coli]
MRENILNMPHHLRRLRVVTGEQAAMAMAGVYSCSGFDELRDKCAPEIYNIASSYLKIILSAVNAGELHPKIKWSNSPGGGITGADFYSKDIWPWALEELSAPDIWFGYDEENTSQAIESVSEVWGKFAGKDTALKLIAGMAIALEKKGGKYVRGKNLNKSEVARSASRLILEHGEGIDVTDKALTMLIDEALSMYASKSAN